MKIVLAGHNIDIEILRDIRDRFENIARNLDRFTISNYSERELRQAAENASRIATEVLTKDNLTPETLSAAYARISRLPLPIPEIRRAAREGVSRARRSNQQIVFGLGHKSIAEHAVFNFDVLEISRLAIEFVQNNRLCSFTEKSQRYIKLKEGAFVPTELNDSPLLEQFNETMQLQFAFYRQLFDTIYQYLCQKHPDLTEDSNGLRSLENLAGEDARYILPLATYSQMGMTLNARALEGMVWKANSHPLQEVRDFAAELQKVANKIAPSLVRYTEPSEEYYATEERIKPYLPSDRNAASDRGEDSVRLLHYPEAADDRLLASLLFSKGTDSWDACMNAIRSFDKKKKKILFCDAMKGIGVHDPVWREFETLDFDFEVVLSASAYAQLKRHRMSCQLVQPYDPNYGVMVPLAVKAVGLQKEFMGLIRKSSSIYQKIAKDHPAVAAYILTNAHRRRMLLHVNARELYHIARLRMDQTAQWEIREIVYKITGLAKEKCPLTLALATGKDEFDQTSTRFYESD